MTDKKDPAAELFIDRYGGKPFPRADYRGDLIQLYGELLRDSPIFGNYGHLFVEFGFWYCSVVIRILNMVIQNKDLIVRLWADYNYLKDSFYSGYDDQEEPPNPP